MFWLVIVPGILVLVIGLVALLGALQPAHHEASREITVPQPPERAWALISDIERWPTWNKYVKHVERLPEREGRPVYRIADKNGTIPSEIMESVHQHRLVTRIADPSLPFGGTWTWQVRPEGSGTRISITERGEVRNPIFRFVARFLIGHTRTMDAYLQALSQELGERPPPPAR